SILDHRAVTALEADIGDAFLRVDADLADLPQIAADDGESCSEADDDGDVGHRIDVAQLEIAGCTQLEGNVRRVRHLAVALDSGLPLERLPRHQRGVVGAFAGDVVGNAVDGEIDNSAAAVGGIAHAGDSGVVVPLRAEHREQGEDVE